MAERPSNEEIQGFLNRSPNSTISNEVDTSRPPPEAIQSFLERRKFDAPLTAGALGAARTLSFGLSDVALTKSGIFEPEELTKYREYNPTATGVGEFGSLALSVVPTGGIGLLGGAARIGGAGLRGAAKAGSVVERAVASQFAKKAAQTPARKILSEAASKSAGLALEGGFYGAGQVVSEAALENPELTTESALATIGLAGVLSGAAGGVLNVTGKTIKSLAKNTPKISKKAFSKIRGIDEETIDVVMKRSDEVAEFEKLGKDYNEAVENYTTKWVDDFKSIERAKVDDLTNRIDLELAAKESARFSRKISIKDLLTASQKIKARFAPDGVAVGSQAKKAIRDLDRFVEDIKSLGTANYQGTASDEVLTSLIKNIDPGGQSIRGIDAIKNRTFNPAITHLTKGKKVFTREGRRLGRRVPTDFIGKRAPRVDELFITPRQLNALRQQLNKEGQAAYNYKLGQGNKSTAEAFSSLANAARQMLDDYVSPEIRRLNKEISEIYNARQTLSTFGLADFDIDPKRVAKLFETGDKTFRGSAKTAARTLDRLLGTNIISQRELIQAAKQLNTKSALFVAPTGLSTLLPGLGFAAGIPFGTAVAAGASVGLAGLQAPMFTGSILKGARKIGESGIGSSIRQTTSGIMKYVPDELVPFVAAKMAVLGTLQREQELVQRKIKSNVSRIIKDKPLKSNFSVKYKGLVNFKNGSQGSRDAYKKTLYQLNDLISNPIKLQEQVTENLRQLALVAPDTAQSMQFKSMQAVKYLYENAPKPASLNPFNNRPDAYVPSDTELNDFDDRVRTMNDPLSIFQDIKNNQLSRASVEVIQSFYPKIYQAIVEEFMTQGNTANSNLTFNQRLQLAHFFGVNTEQALKPNLFQLLQAPFTTSEDEQNETPIDIKTPELDQANRVQFR